MLYRLVIDVLASKMELRDASGGLATGLESQPTLLDVRVNRFIPGDFVFRCKVVYNR